MVLELDIGRYAMRGVPTRTLGPEWGGLGDPTSIGEGNLETSS